MDVYHLVVRVKVIGKQRVGGGWVGVAGTSGPWQDTRTDWTERVAGSNGELYDVVKSCSTV